MNPQRSQTPFQPGSYHERHDPLRHPPRRGGYRSESRPAGPRGREAGGQGYQLPDDPAQRFTAACKYEIRFGKKYPGKSLAEVGRNDEGLCYLDWLLQQDWVNGTTRDAIECYMNHPTVAKLANAALEHDDRRRT